MPLNNRKTQTIGIVISLLLHVLLVLLFLLPDPRAKSLKVASAPVRIIPASMLKKQNQIVSESRGKKIEKAPNTKYQAAENKVVEKQQIKRGLEDAGKAVGPRQPQSPPAKLTKPSKVKKPNTRPKQTVKKAKAAPKPPKKVARKIKKPLDLRARSLSNFGIYKPQPKPAAQAKKQQRDFSSVQPFSRPAGSGARFLGLSGSSDYLPDLPDGDLTLLNTKAHKYAVFVRRVAVRVFTALRASGWQHLARSDVMRIQDNSVVQVKMNAKGEIANVTVVNQSGSQSFDRSLIRASKASKDPNTPKSALNSDNTLTLEFYARTWSQASRAGPRAPIQERRWLFLGTALY